MMFADCSTIRFTIASLMSCAQAFFGAAEYLMCYSAHPV